MDVGWLCSHFSSCGGFVSKQTIHIRELPIDSRVFTHRQRLEVRRAAFDLAAFAVAQVLVEQAALGFHHEVQALVPIALDQYSPVRVVATQGCRHLEPAWELGVDLDRVVFLQLVGKLPLHR